MDAIYIGCTIGIYYPAVRRFEQQFISDHLVDYPVIAGSVSHYSGRQELMSVLYRDGENPDEVAGYIKDEIQNGAFELLKAFQDLDSIRKGIMEKHL